MTRWFLSKHALDRANEMGLTRSGIVSVLENPDITFPNKRGNFHAVGNGFSVVYHDDVVVTVLADRSDPKSDQSYVPRKMEKA